MEQRDSRDQGSSTKRLLIGAVAVLLFAGVVAGAWTLGTNLRSGSGEEADPSADATEDVVDSAELEVLPIAASDGFDPLGDGSEHGDKAGLAHDGDPSTQWNTEGYKDPMGTEKAGVGLLIDLGSAKEVHELDLITPDKDFGMQIRVGDDVSATDPAALDAALPVAWEGSVNGSETVQLEESVTGQYVVVWFVELPADGDRYRGSVNEVEVRGL